MNIRRVLLAPIAGTFLAGYIVSACGPAQCTYTNAITHQQFTAPCNMNPGPGGGGPPPRDDDGGT
jgi:hypothetical protein